MEPLDFSVTEGMMEGLVIGVTSKGYPKWFDTRGFEDYRAFGLRAIGLELY